MPVQVCIVSVEAGRMATIAQRIRLDAAAEAFNDNLPMRTRKRPPSGRMLQDRASSGTASLRFRQ